MSDVKWIKIVTDIFDDEKILLIESMPEADGIIVCWFKLLCLAGKTNKNGVLLVNNHLAFTDEMLAHIFRRPIKTVRLALGTFERFGMIEIINQVITIPNWSKHQKMDALEKKRENQRLLMAKHRAEQKRLALCEANCEANSEANKAANGEANKAANGEADKKANKAANGEANCEANVSPLEQEEDIDITTTSSNTFLSGGLTGVEGIELGPEEADRLRESHGAILDAAESAGFPTNAATMDKLIQLYAEYGKEPVLAGISACVDQGNTKLSYLKACIRRMTEGRGRADDPLSGGKDHDEYWD